MAVRQKGVRGSNPKDPRFTPVDLAALWPRLELTGTQLAALTGISRRQVEWWRRRGYLPPAPGAPDRYGGNAVEIALLIKQAVEAGIPLRRAHELAAAHMAARLAPGVGEAADRAAGRPGRPNLADLAPDLRAAVGSVELVLLAVEAQDAAGSAADAG
jgi:DNA-binding transcriptional MerR regulator